jgi:mannosyltransferase
MKYVPAICIIVLALAISIAISVLTLLNQSIRLDEAQSVWVYTKSFSAFMHLTAEDVLVPLYGTLLHFWMQIFGTSTYALRAMSMVFFIATVPLLYKLSKSISNKKIAYLTIFLFCLSPFILWYANETRMYTLFLFISTLNNYYFIKLYKSDGKYGKFGLFISIVLGLYTHYIFLFLLVTQVIFIILKMFGVLKTANDFNYSPTVSNFARYRELAVKYIGIVICAGIFFVPWIVYVISLGGAANTMPQIPPPSTFNIFQVFVEFLFGFQSNTLQSILISSWPIILLMMLFLFTRQKEMHIQNIEYIALVTFLPVMLVFIASFVKPFFLSRYLIFTTPTLFFLIAAALLSYSKRLAVSIISILFAIMITLIYTQNVSASTPVKENYKTATEFLNQNVKPDDIIVISSPFTIYPFEYYFNGNTAIQTIPQWDRYAHGPIPAFNQQTFEKQISDNKKIYHNIYLLLSYDQGYQKKIIDYMDKHYQLKLAKSFSPGLQVREYQLKYFK